SPPSGLVFETTPPTRISLSVTPGWSTFGNCCRVAFDAADVEDALSTRTDAPTVKLTSTAVARWPSIATPCHFKRRPRPALQPSGPRRPQRNSFERVTPRRYGASA